MNDQSTQRVTAITAVLQLAVLVVGVGGLFFAVGQREESLNGVQQEVSDLKGISADLVKAQILSTAKDGEHERVLRDILRRVERLEESN